MKRLALFAVPLWAGLFFAASASATSVGGGTFNLVGSAIGTTNGIDFFYANNMPPDQQAAAVDPIDGTFINLSPGTVQTIQNLTAANGVVPGGSFDFANWIQLTDGIDLAATALPIPSFPVCPTSGSVANGYECLVNAMSPVVLTQGLDGVSARFNIAGVAYYAGQTTYTPFIGLFTSPSTDFSTIASFDQAYLANNMIPEVSYSASFTTAPEPDAFWMIGTGLVGFGLLKRRNPAHAKA